MTSIDVKIFEKNFIGLNDQKLPETYFPERIFAKNAFLNFFEIFPLGIFADLEFFSSFFSAILSTLEHYI